VTARLPVRRVPDRNPAGPDELFAAWRYHAVFTDSPYGLVQAEAQHRDHAGQQVGEDAKARGATLRRHLNPRPLDPR
jgi:hypothetical protein